MQMIGYTERRYFNGSNFLGALFQKPDGEEFEMAISPDQLAVLLAESGQVGPTARRRPATRVTPAPSPVMPPGPPLGTDFADAMGDDDFEEVDGPTIRLATFDSGNAGGGGDDL